MPTAHGYRTEVLRAGADLRKSQFRAIKRDSNGLAVLAGAGDDIIGVIQQVEGQGVAGKDVVTYFVDGDHPALAGAASIARDARLVSDAQGRLVAAAPGAGVEVRSYYRCLEAADLLNSTFTVRREVADVRGA